MLSPGPLHQVARPRPATSQKDARSMAGAPFPDSGSLDALFLSNTRPRLRCAFASRFARLQIPGFRHCAQAWKSWLPSRRSSALCCSKGKDGAEKPLSPKRVSTAVVTSSSSCNFKCCRFRVVDSILHREITRYNAASLIHGDGATSREE